MIRLRLQKLLFGLVAINTLPHFWDLPLWTSLAAGALLVWRGLNLWKQFPGAGRWVRSILVLAFTSIIFSQFGTLMGPDAATPLFVLMVCTKQFEIRSPRDIVVIAFLCFLLLMYKLIASQSIAMTIFLFVDVVLITSFLGIFHSTSQRTSFKQMFARSLKIAAIGLPILAIMFAVFPRFSAGLWRPDKPKAITGFNDEIRPGSVAQMAQSEAIAFRASFTDFIPPTDTLYWRGAVLTENLGLNWEKGDSYWDYGNIRAVKGVSFSKLEYEVTLEPHQQKWIFALDWPDTIDIISGSVFAKPVMKVGRSFAAGSTVFSRIQYKGVSFRSSHSKMWPAVDKERFLQLPSKYDSSIKKLAEKLHFNSQNTEGFVQRILDYYRDEGFSYTLQPGKMSRLRDFFYGDKKGFCEHYASATANLLRMGGVPSRVVVGFHGGTAGIMRDYLTVRNQDAHAWVEYWDKERNLWERVDPTSVVAPERLLLGGYLYRNRQMVDPESAQGDLSQGSSWLTQTYFRTQLIWDMVEMTWISFLLGYDFEKQKKLFSKFGLKNISRWGLIVLSVVGTGLLLVLLYLFLLRRKPKRDPATEAYFHLLKKLDKAGIGRSPADGPLTVAAEAKTLWPSLEEDLSKVFDTIIRARYSHDEFEYSQFHQLKRQIRDLKFPRN